MKTNTLVLMLLCLLMSGAAFGGAPAQTGQPAVWIAHDMIVSLQDLPKRYSCDDLWYKFRDVLLAIGARPDMRILAYQCGAALGTLARSPRVELKFELPSEVHGAQTQWADVSVVTQTVRIAPGDPPSIDAGDCVLLRQIKSALLDSLPVRVVASNLACTAPQRSHPRFGISAQALTPVNGGEKRVVATDLIATASTAGGRGTNRGPAPLPC